MTNAVLVAGSYYGDVENPWDDFPFQQKLNDAGGVYPHGNRATLPNRKNTLGVFGIAIDAAGNTYLACRLRSYDAAQVAADYSETVATTYKIDPNGNVIWAANHGCNLYDIAVDSSGNIYTFGGAIDDQGNLRASKSQTTGFNTTRCYSSSGALLWSADHGWSTAESYGFPCPSKIVYRNGFVYTTGYSTANGTGDLVKYNASNGTIVWKAVTPSDTYIDDIIWDISVDSSDNVYLCGMFFNPPISYPPIPLTYILKKYNSAGSFVGWIPKQGIVNGQYPIARTIQLDSDGNIILGLMNLFSGNEGNYSLTYFLKYSASLNYIGEGPAYPYGSISNNYPISIALDSSNNIYAISLRNREYGIAYRNVQKYDHASFDVVWQQVLYTSTQQMIAIGGDQDTIGNDIDAYCVALSIVETPPLQLKIALQSPGFLGDKICQADSLGLSFWIASPVLLRDYVGVPSPTIYRAFLGDASPIEIPIKSFQIRSDSLSTTVSLVAPLLSPTMLLQIMDRSAQTLVIRRGVRLTSGVEQLDPLIAVLFTDLRYDAGSQSGSLSLTGATSYSASPLKPRRLRGISYRNETGGARRVRCEVDTYLQIGDTALLGGNENLTVASITIAVDARTATMEVSE